jgi:hypothetical protein
MRKLMGSLIVAGASAAVVVALGGAGFPARVAGQSGQSQLPRTADGKPDLNGIWQTMNTANWNLEDHSGRAPAVPAMGAVGAVRAGRSVVEGGDIPYKPDALAKRKKNADSWLTEDPEVKCYMPGVPRAMYLPMPFQIVQNANFILMAFEYASVTRPIYMTKVEPPPIDTWMGHSVGRWEKDTLVIQTDTFNDLTWFDRAGNYHSDQLKVTERITPMTRDALNYEATIEDPQVFTRPWKISMPLYRHLEPRAELMEFNCVEFVEETLWGHLKKKGTK